MYIHCLPPPNHLNPTVDLPLVQDEGGRRFKKIPNPKLEAILSSYVLSFMYLRFFRAQQRRWRYQGEQRVTRNNLNELRRPWTWSCGLNGDLWRRHLPSHITPGNMWPSSPDGGCYYPDSLWGCCGNGSGACGFLCQVRFLMRTGQVWSILKVSIFFWIFWILRKKGQLNQCSWFCDINVTLSLLWCFVNNTSCIFFPPINFALISSTTPLKARRSAEVRLSLFLQFL